MLDDLVGALIGGLIGDAIHGGIVHGRARRKAKRFVAGQPIRFRAYLKYDTEDRPRRGRIVVRPGSEIATWTPWPRWRQPRLDLTLLGGEGDSSKLTWGWLRNGVPGHSWRVRIGADDAAWILLERSYLAAFAPILSLGSVPARPHGRRARRR